MEVVGRHLESNGVPSFLPLSLSTSLMRVLIKVERIRGDVLKIHFYHFVWACVYVC